MPADFVVVHDRIGQRAVCAVGAVCGDRAIIGIGTADDDENDARERRDTQAKAKRAGLRALRRFAAKAAPIVLTATPGGALAREASTALLESRRAASDVQTAQEHAQQVTGLLSPLAIRVIGARSEEAEQAAQAANESRARTLLRAVNDYTRASLWPFYRRVLAARRHLQLLPARSRERVAIETFDRMAREARDLAMRLEAFEGQLEGFDYGIELVDPQHPARSLYRLVPLWENDDP